MMLYREYRLLNAMLDAAISGDFQESRFDESELSRLQTKLMRYLSSSAMSQRRLQEEKARLEALVTNISHQTKTPLTNILLYTELLKERAREGEVREYADEIYTQSKKLEELIKALAKMSRLETGIFRFRREKTLLLNVLKAAAAQAAPRARDKGIQLLIGEGQDAYALLDAKWMTEAVYNILDNAVKYSAEGEEIALAVFSYEAFSGIRITDQGIGIAEDEIPQIFARFYRGTAVQDKEGIGVGLTLARQIVKGHGGYIKVRSVLGKGSSFDICVPNVTTP